MSHARRQARHPGRVRARHPGRTRVLGAAAGYLAKTMPWPPLLAGCGAGAAMLAVAAAVGAIQEPGAVAWAIRITFVPVIAALAFLPGEPDRELATAFPVPAWLAAGAHLAMAVPVVAATAWVQFRLAAAALSARAPSTVASPGSALSVEVTAWCAIALAVAAFVARTRWHDLGGAVAAPLTLLLLIALGAGPLHLLPGLPAGARAGQAAWAHAHQTWALLAVTAAGLACWASRDRWSRVQALVARADRRRHRLPCDTLRCGNADGGSGERSRARG